ncbi:unnamed protein product [Rhizoctonia solani]|uniref:Cyclin-like domain-containing protein n=1 Tax=Rhizoctonia solani TaxID=456999 RepID=A0A8H3E6C7_9AGAM|nr:unnamed protein product [Rhizoctonia solani]
MEDEASLLPLDLNPVADSLLHLRLAPFNPPNPNLYPLVPNPAGSVNTKPLAKPQVPPRPKPPIPSEYFVYPKRSWRSMNKGQVRIHILDRYRAKQRYMDAYKEWEEKHNKWVFGIYQLVRAVTKSRRHAVPPELGGAREERTEGPLDAEEGATTPPTDIIGDLDVGFATALTALQEGAEVDELDRVRRWWARTTRQNRPRKKVGCDSTPVLPILSRQDGGFGYRGLGSMERHGTPDVELPHQAALKIHSSISTCVPPKLLPGQGDHCISQSEDDDQEEDEESHPLWRIYSEQCACGYAGCHCRSWMRWWNKTFEMLKYVEYVDLPVSLSDVSGVPAPVNELPGGPATHYTRVRAGERRELVKRQPPLRSLHKPKGPKSKKRTEHSELTPQKLTSRHVYLVPVDAETRNQDESTDALDVQPPAGCIYKVCWEDYVDVYPKLPAEYQSASFQNIWDQSPLCTPRSVLPARQWASRNRALQWIAYVHYAYRTPAEIFFLAVNLLDRFAAGCQQVTHMTGSHWDLVGFTCLWLAWKYENYLSVPRIEDIIAHSGVTLLTRNDVIRAERTVHATIGLDLFYTSPLTIARLGVRERPRETRYVAKFLAEISTTVRELVCCPPPVASLVSVWLACVLTDMPTPEIIQRHYNKARDHQVAMYVLMGVLNMPRPIEKPREQALFYKWTLPIVNNIAGWCQATLDSVWPDRASDGILPCFEERLPELRAIARSQPFELGPGPPPDHALFED